MRRSPAIRAAIRMLLAAAASVPTISPAAGADLSGQCQASEMSFGSGRVVCAVEADARARRMRIEVRFDGVHDDSEASIRMDLDGTPLACSPDDKRALSGQSGDEGQVSLTCTFDLPAGAGNRHALCATLAFHHALYAGVTLRAE